MVKNLPANVADTGDVGSIPRSGRLPGEHGNLIQYSCLGNRMDRRAWWATVHGVTKRQTQLSTHTHSFTLQDSACEGWGIASINTVQIPCPSGANIVVVGGRGTQEAKYTTPLYILWGGSMKGDM